MWTPPLPPGLLHPSPATQVTPGPQALKLRWAHFWSHSYFPTTYSFGKSRTEIKSELIQVLWPRGLVSLILNKKSTSTPRIHIHPYVTTGLPNIVQYMGSSGLRIYIQLYVTYCLPNAIQYMVTSGLCIHIHLCVTSGLSNVVPYMAIFSLRIYIQLYVTSCYLILYNLWWPLVYLMLYMYNVRYMYLWSQYAYTSLCDLLSP